MTGHVRILGVGKHERNPRLHREGDIAAMVEAARRMRIAHGPDHPEHRLWEALASLMDKTVRIGRAEPDFLSRVPCDEVIAAAKAYLEADVG